MMKSVIAFIIFTVAMLGSQHSFAQAGINTGGSVGLFNIPSPNTLGKSGIEIGMLGRYSQYHDSRAKVAEALFGVTYGLTDRLDISLLIPYGYINADNKGVENVTLSAKYRLGRIKRIVLALNPILYLPTGNKEHELGSESFGFQVIVNSGIQLSRSNLYMNFGFGLLDYFVNTQRVFVNTEIFTFSGGLTYKLLPSFTLIVEGVLQRIPEFSDEGFYFQLGGILKITKSLLLKGSGGVELFDDVNAVPKVRSIVGVSYVLK